MQPQTMKVIQCGCGKEKIIINVNVQVSTKGSDTNKFDQQDLA